MTKLAESSGTVVYEDGKKIYISKRPAQWTTVFLFVTGLLTLIVLVNGVIQFINPTTEPSSLGIILIGVGLFLAFVFWRVWLYRKKVQATPPDKLEMIAIIDLANNTLLDAQQNILSSLNQAWLSRKMQITSSSPELLLSWAGGSISIVNGNPFSGGIAGIERALVAKGIRKK